MYKGLCTKLKSDGNEAHDFASSQRFVTKPYRQVSSLTRYALPPGYWKVEIFDADRFYAPEPIQTLYIRKEKR